MDSEPSDLNCLFVEPQPHTDRECDFGDEIAASMHFTGLSVKAPDYFPEEKNFQNHRESKRLRVSWRKSSHIMAAILRSGKFLRLFSGVARYVAKDLLN